MTNKETLKLEIGNRIKEIRENKMHMSKHQFAQLIGMQDQYLGAVENGQKGLTVEKVIETCNKTNLSADYILRGITPSTEESLRKILSTYSIQEINKSFEILKNLSILLK